FNKQPRLGVAITPFNFTYISLPALMGNVVLWIPSEKQLYYTNILMEIFKKSGLPDGVINCLNCKSKTTSNVILKHPNGFYKNFIWVHPNSNPKEVSKALLYGAFESQINVSRAYIPKFLWKKSIKKKLIENIHSMKLGSTRNFSNLITSLIDKISFLKLKGYIDRAQNDNNCNIIIGGKCDSSKGYFITPTVIETINPYYESMIDEIFGPVLTVYLYEDCNWEKTISLVKNLKSCFTGYIFCDDRDIISYLTKKFKYYAGNIFINYNQY
ncbi:delta-1-pyrroline-5-carboxylate dehydrogenase, partial [Candidatus Sulcia muelleri str. Hc (Homalodisca coagulata)]